MRLRRACASLLVRRPPLTLSGGREAAVVEGRTGASRACALRLALVFFAAVSFTAAPARAGELVVVGETGPEYLAGDTFALVEPSLRWRGDRAQLELAAPLRLRLGSPGPGGAADRWMRGRDWDSLSDAGRALRRFELELGERTAVVRAGALAHLSLGHGTLVNDFSMQLDPNQAPLGATARVAVGALAVDLLASDLLALAVVGVSASVEPLALFGADSDRVHLNAAVFADPRAPRAAGAPAVTLFGAGLDVVALRARAVTLAPYVDVNARAAAGQGLHAGLLADLSLEPAAISLKAEWRRTTGAYLPEYFDGLYAVERWDAGASAGAGLGGKADVTRPASNTGRVEARAAVGPVFLSAAAASLPGGGIEGSAIARLEFDALEFAALAARRAPWPQASGAGAERVVALGEARYRFTRFVHAWLSAGRLYLVERGAARPVNQLGAGLGVALGD